MKSISYFRLMTVAGASLLLSQNAVQAQPAAADYPNRQVRVVVPYAPGGATDLVARTISSQLTERLKRPFIVDNRTGGGGVIGADAVVRSAPDGYTLLFHSGAITIDPSFKKNLPYDVRRDLIPVTMAVTGPFVVLTSNATQAKTLPELLALARAKPGTLNFGSPGLGTSIHLASELFKSMAKLDIVHVPFRGEAPSLIAVSSNEIQILVNTILTAKPLVDAGKMRLLAVTSRNRSAVLPNVPTVNESGVPGYESFVWLGFFAPAGTPKDIVNKLYAEVRAVLQQPAVKARLLEQGLEVAGEPPEEFAKWIDQEIARWATVIRAAGIEPQ